MKKLLKLKKVSSCFTFLLAFMVVSLSACTQQEILNVDDSLEDGKRIITEKDHSFDEFEKVRVEERNVLLETILKLKQIEVTSPELFTRSFDSPIIDPPILPEPVNSIDIAALSLLTSLDFSDKELEPLMGENIKLENLTENEVLGLAFLAYSVNSYIRSDICLTSNRYSGYLKDIIYSDISLDDIGKRRAIFRVLNVNM